MKEKTFSKLKSLESKVGVIWNKNFIANKMVHMQ